MTENTKTTVYLDAADYRRLQALARAEGRATADLVREAVAVYAAARTSKAGPTSIGAGRSGRKNLSERAESLLGGMGRKK
jgi:predicted transcriptional regulator